MNQNMFFAVLSSAVSVLLIGACAHKHPVAEVSSTEQAQQQRVPASKPALPDQAQWQAFEDKARSLDLNASNIQLKMSSGGSSVYAIIVEDGNYLGAVLPENAATKLSGEIVAFHLSRALGVSDIYQPGVYLELSGENLKTYRKFLLNTPINAKPGSLKDKNLTALQKFFATNPTTMKTAFKLFGIKGTDYDALVTGSNLNTSHVIPGGKTPFARLLQCSGPMPSPDIQLSFNKGKASELELAKQLSSILLIDALTGQWDRFSGGNLQTVTENGVVKFISYDNGGTWAVTNWTPKNLKLVTRVDSAVAAQILKLDDFFAKGGTYEGMESQEDVFTALGIANFPEAWPNFKKALKMTAAHLRSSEVCHF